MRTAVFQAGSFEYAVQARKHIFAEKPVGVDPAGIRSVMAAGRMAESAGLNVAVEHKEGISMTMSKPSSR
jgi:predicted dehydrogenase